jgi:hypothetical protein
MNSETLLVLDWLIVHVGLPAVTTSFFFLMYLFFHDFAWETCSLSPTTSLIHPPQEKGHTPSVNYLGVCFLTNQEQPSTKSQSTFLTEPSSLLEGQKQPRTV